MIGLKKFIRMITFTGFSILASCSYNIGEFSIVSTGTPQYDQMGKIPTTKKVKGTDGRLSFFFLPLGEKPSFKDAVNDCLDNGKGDFIERVRFTETNYYFIVFNYQKYIVTGDVGNSKFNFEVDKK